MKVPEISAKQALERLEDGATVFIDVRDGGSYRRGHIPDATNIGDHNIEDFVARADKNEPVIVYCYQGNSSLGGAAHLLDQGFAEVYSMTGGFAAWGDQPTESEPEPERPTRPVAAPIQPQDDTRRPSRKRRLFNRIRSLLGP